MYESLWLDDQIFFYIFINGTSCIKLIDYKTYFPKREKFPLENDV